MDRRRSERHLDRDEGPPDPSQMYGLMREMVQVMQATQQQMQQQQQLIIQQQQQLMQHFNNPAPRAPAPVAPREGRDRQIKLPEFAKLVHEFMGDKADPMGAESWIIELEKAFDIGQVAEERKLSLAVFLLKKDGYNWWRRVSAGLVNPTWHEFRDLFFREYFPDATREQMTSDWLKLKQGGMTVDEYEAEFSRLLRFAGEGYQDNERMKVQKFQNGLNPEIRHEVKVFEVATLSAAIHKAKVVEKSKIDCGNQYAKKSSFLGKRPQSSFYSKSYGQGSGWQGKGKKSKYTKPIAQQISKEEESKTEGVICRRCFGPHEVENCKWTPGACFSCGQVGHRSSECKNPILKPVFCFHCGQRGHQKSQCKEKGKSVGSSSGSNNNNNKGKSAARVYTLQHEEAPTIETLAGNVSVSTCDAYALIDTGATHTCISKEFATACGLSFDVVANAVICVSTPLGDGSVD